MADSAEDFRRVEMALRLLRAYRADLSVHIQRNPAWRAALRGLVDGMTTHEHFEEEMGRVVQGLAILANILTEGLAKNSNTSPERVIHLYEEQTQANIAQLRGE
jgi:hypothetical protein